MSFEEASGDKEGARHFERTPLGASSRFIRNTILSLSLKEKTRREIINCFEAESKIP